MNTDPQTLERAWYEFADSVVTMGLQMRGLKTPEGRVHAVQLLQNMCPKARRNLLLQANISPMPPLPPTDPAVLK